jgi:hypothetical protein
MDGDRRVKADDIRAGVNDTIGDRRASYRLKVATVFDSPANHVKSYATWTPRPSVARRAVGKETRQT